MGRSLYRAVVRAWQEGSCPLHLSVSVSESPVRRTETGFGMRHTRVLAIGCAAVGALALAASGFSASVAEPVGGLDWNANATAFRGQNGLRVIFKCPAGGTIGTVYGTGVYTDDSKVCSAAVHAGLITPAAGGTVTVKILPGRPNYSASTKNGVTSNAYASWSGSYSFVVAPKATGPILDGGSTWAANAVKWAAQKGGRYRYACPPNGKLGKVYGSGTYSTASSVCSAAVHAGQISVTQGGNVVILVVAGKSSYSGTVKNGVTSQASPASPGSFTFTKP